MTLRRRDIGIAFGRVLREARLAKGLSQDALAAMCDMDRTYPSLVERGLRTPTLSMILRLAEALETSPVEMVAKTYDMLRPTNSNTPPHTPRPSAPLDHLRGGFGRPPPDSGGNT